MRLLIVTSKATHTLAFHAAFSVHFGYTHFRNHHFSLGAPKTSAPELPRLMVSVVVRFSPEMLRYRQMCVSETFHYEQCQKSFDCAFACSARYFIQVLKGMYPHVFHFKKNIGIFLAPFLFGMSLLLGFFTNIEEHLLTIISKIYFYRSSLWYSQNSLKNGRLILNSGIRRL